MLASVILMLIRYVSKALLVHKLGNYRVKGVLGDQSMCLEWT